MQQQMQLKNIQNSMAHSVIYDKPQLIMQSLPTSQDVVQSIPGPSGSCTGMTGRCTTLWDRQRNDNIVIFFISKVTVFETHSLPCYELVNLIPTPQTSQYQQSQPSETSYKIACDLNLIAWETVMLYPVAWGCVHVSVQAWIWPL